IDFVDIAPVQPMHLAQTERYFCEDAEKWVRLAEEKYDCILSSSTIQWFANIPEFINSCSRLLRPGGVILVSSFTQGNLGELDSLRPSPIHYHSPEEYRKWFERNFDDTAVLTEEITLRFSSPRELMMHLKHTGVGGSAPSPGISPSVLRAIDRITYRPVYISATKGE
ncbi:MAG: methyltransferase domain-containing protein, partial [Muribaculaceae bacterium]|nr:methyltransferase domain-containing protein [Muribaculaceae bacterium]